MGIPYSREINKAFSELNKAYGQVTPLIEAAYEVLETTKNISLLLAGIQVLTVILLSFILLALVGLLITMNPEMERERTELVTPALRWVTGWMTMGGIGTAWWCAIGGVFGLVMVGVVVVVSGNGEWVRERVRERMGGFEGEEGGEEGEGGGGG